MYIQPTKDKKNIYLGFEGSVGNAHLYQNNTDAKVSPGCHLVRGYLLKNLMLRDMEYEKKKIVITLFGAHYFALSRAPLNYQLVCDVARARVRRRATAAPRMETSSPPPPPLSPQQQLS